MQLTDDGQPLRDAVAKAGLSTREIADKTRDIDGYGVSQSLVGALLSKGKSKRRTCQKRSAELIAAAIADALGGPAGDWFRP